MLGSELASEASGLRRLIYNHFGTLDIDERIWYWCYQKCFFKLLLTPNVLHVLDAGCGDGLWSFYLARRFPNHRITGIDIRQSATDHNLRLTKYYPSLPLDFRTIPFLSLEYQAEFDVILSFFSLHYSHKFDVEILKLFAHALKPGGFLMLSVPAAKSLWQHSSISHESSSRLEVNYGISFDSKEISEHYKSNELSLKISQAGFEVLEMRRLVGPLGQVAKSLYASAGRHSLQKTCAWPVAITLAGMDALLSTKKGMAWFVLARRLSS